MTFVTIWSFVAQGNEPPEAYPAE